MVDFASPLYRLALTIRLELYFKAFNCEVSKSELEIAAYIAGRSGFYDGQDYAERAVALAIGLDFKKLKRASA